MPPNEQFSVVVLEENPVHTRITVLNYGGHAGTLTINTKDAQDLMRRIGGPPPDAVTIANEALDYLGKRFGLEPEDINVMTLLSDLADRKHKGYLKTDKPPTDGFVEKLAAILREEMGTGWHVEEVDNPDPVAEWDEIAENELPLYEELTSNALPIFTTVITYRVGDDGFDASYEIEGDEDKWLGECGMGISQTYNTQAPRWCYAMELWLFDKTKTRTVTNVLVPHSVMEFDDLTEELKPRGKLVPIVPNQLIEMSTPTLTLQAKVRTVEETPIERTTCFQKLEIEVAVFEKEANDEG